MMFSKTLGTFMLAVSLSTPMVAQVVETPPSQTSWGYVNEEEKERFEQVIAPIISGEVGLMAPSNYTNPRDCEKDAQYLEWLHHYRNDGYEAIDDYTLAYLNMYEYVRAMSVLENRDCSCATRNPPTAPVADLFYSQPVSKGPMLKGKVMNTTFFRKLTSKAVDFAEEFCGGRL
jgi:hypothetical protein